MHPEEKYEDRKYNGNHYQQQVEADRDGGAARRDGRRRRRRRGGRRDHPVGQLESDRRRRRQRGWGRWWWRRGAAQVTSTAAFHPQNRCQVRRHASDRRQPGGFVVQAAGQGQADDPAQTGDPVPASTHEPRACAQDRETGAERGAGQLKDCHNRTVEKVDIIRDWYAVGSPGNRRNIVLPTKNANPISSFKEILPFRLLKSTPRKFQSLLFADSPRNLTFYASYSLSNDKLTITAFFFRHT